VAPTPETANQTEWIANNTSGLGSKLFYDLREAITKAYESCAVVQVSC
jgi:hypothetical protein